MIVELLSYLKFNICCMITPFRESLSCTLSHDNSYEKLILLCAVHIPEGQKGERVMK